LGLSLRATTNQKIAKYPIASLIGAVVSFQITVLKVLAGHPGGRLPIDDLKYAVSLLICSGPDWSDRMKRLLGRAPDLDIFSQQLVVRDDEGWQITEAGRIFLVEIETPPKPAGATCVLECGGLA
jgi:hypothetical protein